MSELPTSDEELKQEASVRFTPPTVVPNFISSPVSYISNDDGLHKFILTARMKFKVNNVVLATQEIEGIVIKNRGFIIKSGINNQNSVENIIRISKDSVKVFHEYNLIGDLELRVPYTSLDSTLRQLAPLAVLIDYRTIDATDVTAKLMTERLRQQRLAKKQQRLSTAINTRSGKVGDVVDAEESLDKALENADNAKVEEFLLNDRINYSTIYISLYQERIQTTEKLFQPENSIKEYSPGFGTRLGESISNGWNALCSLFILMMNLWPILLLVITLVAFLVIRRRN